MRRPQLSYANVMSSIAVFVALGGTSYAVATLPKNSVGPKQIRSGAVGASEIRSDAVRAREIRNRTIALGDISFGARRSLRGQQGPTGPPGPSLTPLTAAVNAAGGVTSTTASQFATHGGGTGVYDVNFNNRDLRACYAVATLSRVDGGLPTEPDTGEIVTSTTAGGVVVRTRNSSGQPADLPFHVIVVC
jgi:hypothetical protein